MKSHLLSAFVVSALCMTSSVAIAMHPANMHAPTPSPKGYVKELSNCTNPVSQYDLDINNVRARVLDAGDQWWDLSTGHYEVPKGSKTSTTPLPQALYAGAIWVSALDQGNNLRIAAQTYRQGTSDYWPGPLDNNGNVTASTCKQWDQHFPVFGSEITPLIAKFKQQGSTGTLDPGIIPDNVKNWPGKGNPYLISKGYDMSGILAPFYDADGDGIYDPTKGDYPTIKQGGKGFNAFNGLCGHNASDSLSRNADSLKYTRNVAFGDQMIFWAMNDQGNVHTATNGLAMGIQVNELAFAFSSSDEINDMTFYTYNIINKSNSIFSKTYMSQWTDCDLGCANNDRIGCDTSRSLAIQYNGYVQGATARNGVTCDDPDVCPTGEVGYGCDLPMLGIDYFEGPTDTAIDRTTGQHKKLGMSAFCYFNITGQPLTGDPQSAAQFRNYQTGKWQDGTPITYGGSGYGYSSIPFPYTFPGDPSISNQWSECNPQLSPTITAGDRRFVQTSGPFTFLPCASEYITIGVIFIDPTGGVGSNCPSFSLLDVADDKAQALFDAGFQQLQGPSAPLLDIRALDQKVIINLVDDPAGNNIGETYAQTDPLRVNKGFYLDTVNNNHDSLYRFQGYILYQLADQTVSSSDLTNTAKALPIAVFDITDNIQHLVNWTSYVDPASNINTNIPVTSTIPGVGSGLPNTGIKHSLVDSLDLIGGGKMVNHQTYYFGVISFATNNFAPYNPVTQQGQSAPFLLGKNFLRYSAIPSDIQSDDGGTVLQSSYGSSAQVTRLEGQGNGGNTIDLSAKTIAGILSSPLSYLDTLDYVIGQDPIALKVTDPLLLREANFMLTIYDTAYNYTHSSISPKAYWVLQDLTNNIAIHSQRPLDRPYEQIVVDSVGNEYGFSITLGTPFPVYTNYQNQAPVYGPISGTITFQEPAQPWLSFIKDSGQTTVANWIRSGSYTLPCKSSTPDPICNVFVDAYYKTTDTSFFLTDSLALFGGLANGEWSPYCLAANWSAGPGDPYVGGRPTTVGGPAFKWDTYDQHASSPEPTLDQLQSVDVILTSDRTKWTQCVVFETGDNPIPGPDPTGGTSAPRKGFLRNHPSLDINGNIDPSGDMGRSWFPGYAINVETGQRLDMAFGEASDEAEQNGNDMLWNPTSTVYGTLNQGGDVPYAPLFGGRHFIYVFNTVYNSQCAGCNVQSTFQNNYSALINNRTAAKYPQYIRDIYKSIMWTTIPYLSPGYSLASYASGLIPNDITVQLRVQKPYAKYSTLTMALANPQSDSLPRYKFSTVGLGPKVHNDSAARTALDKIRIVPNPYLAYSAYEGQANDAEVKITNLPNNCTINIYTLDGILVRTLTRSLNIDPVTNQPVDLSKGYNLDDQTGSADLDNSVNWNLKNAAAIPVASGVYLFDITVPGVGHKVLKWFGTMRPTDISNF